MYGKDLIRVWREWDFSIIRLQWKLMSKIDRISYNKHLSRPFMHMNILKWVRDPSHNLTKIKVPEA
jgi:hypothetical protein